jgi:hypothetical protein
VRKRLLAGLLAGAAGTAALNAVTYTDMALRGRAGSGIPERLVDRATRAAGLELGDEETAANRRQALAALLGFGVGLGIGAAYGLTGGARGTADVAGGALVLAVAASLASDGPATALGLPDPRTWPAGAWAADAVPHLAYGAVTAVTYAGLTRKRVKVIR